MPTIGPGSASQAQTVTATADTEFAAAVAAADNTANPTVPQVLAHPELFDGTTWNRQRNNGELTILASAARTTDTQSADVVNHNWRGGVFTINVTAGTSAVVFSVQGKDPVSGGYYTILSSASITGAGLTALTVFPGAAVTANVSASAVLPRTFRIDANETGGASLTYSVGFCGVV